MQQTGPDPSRIVFSACQRCTTIALAIILIGAFIGLAAADRSDRYATAVRERDAVAARTAAAVHDVMARDERLLDRLAADSEGAEPTTQNLLALAPTLVPGARAVAVLGADGDILASAPSGFPGSELAEIAAASSRGLSITPGLYVTRAVRAPELGTALIGLARARFAEDGHSAGAALVVIDAASLAPTENLPAGGALLIRRSDGTVLLHLGGTAVAGATAFVPSFPLEVAYGRRAGEIEKAWRAVWLRNGLLVGGAGLLVALAAVLFDHYRRRAAAHAAVREAVTLRQNVAELTAAATRADEASRAKSRFFAQVTHELRTPLNAIIGFSETIQRQMFGPVANARYVEYAGLIRDAGGHLLSLINDLLDIARLEEGKMEIAPVRLSAATLARSSLDLVEFMAGERNVALTVGGADTCPDLTADPRAAKQVLVNLLSNAIKFTPAGGRVALRFTGQRDGGVAITVADTGIGMSTEEIRLAFEPFGRATGAAAATPGTGLGLPIARALMRLHGGDLSLASTPGGGTTATAVFPAGARVRGFRGQPPARAA